MRIHTQELMLEASLDRLVVRSNAGSVPGGGMQVEGEIWKHCQKTEVRACSRVAARRLPNSEFNRTSAVWFGNLFFHRHNLVTAISTPSVPALVSHMILPIAIVSHIDYLESPRAAQQNIKPVRSLSTLVP